MSKKTAVEWLVEKLNQCEPMYSGIKSNEHKEYIDMLIEQAKEMEKEQIKDAWIEATPRNIPKYETITRERAEEYYNKTFKNS
jgi:hypothetical protein